MALPKKGIRKITVNGSKFGWNANGNDGWIDLYVGSLDDNGQLLTASFRYHHNTFEKFDKNNGEVTSYGIKQRFVITSGIVKQVIELGLLKGWKPKEKGKQLNLGYLDEVIKLNLRSGITFPTLQGSQVALNFVKAIDGEYLNISMDEYMEGDDVYLIFDSLNDAKEFAVNIINAHPEIECWIKPEREKAVFFVNVNEQKEFM
jgi:hypothetical protein